MKKIAVIIPSYFDGWQATALHGLYVHGLLKNNGFDVILIDPAFHKNKIDFVLQKLKENEVTHAFVVTGLEIPCC